MVIIFTLTSFCLCCRLLGEFLLPSLNTLPRTYLDLRDIMKAFGMEYNTIDAFPKDYIIYYR